MIFMKQITHFFKKPLNWVIIIVVGVILYFFGGIILKVIVSILSLWIAFWISKFTGPYMKKIAARRTIDALRLALKQAEQIYEINKRIGWIMPYVFAIIFIVTLWTTHDDSEKMTNVATEEQFEDNDVSMCDNIITDEISDAEFEQQGLPNAETAYIQ